MHPIWVTLLLSSLGFSLSTGFLAVTGMNLPFVLDPYHVVILRVAVTGGIPSVVLQVTPILVIEAAPITILPFLAAASVLFSLAVEHSSSGHAHKLPLLVVSLFLLLLTPLPGVYSYPNPLPQIVTLFPQLLIPVIVGFGHPIVRYALPSVAFSLPVFILISRKRVVHNQKSGKVSALPVYVVPGGMSAGMAMVLLGGPILKPLGLILNWSLVTTGLLLWALYYRPSIGRIAFPQHETWLERRLYHWRSPAAAFALTLIVIVLLTALRPVDELLEATALGHHLQHVGIFVAGLAQGGIIYQQVSAYRRGKGILGSLSRFIHVSNVLGNPRGGAGILTAVTLLVLWHIPYFWDLALSDDLIHGLEHACMIGAGSAIAFSLPLMRAWSKYALLLAATILMSLATLALWAAQVPVYSSYSLAQLQELGMYHFLLGMPLAVYAFGAMAHSVLRGSGVEEV